MTTAVLQLLAFAFALWLGLYLLARGQHKAPVALAGLGLGAHALALAAGLLLGQAPPAPFASLLAQAHWLLTFLPAIFWTGALFHLAPESTRLHTIAMRVWLSGLLPLGGLLSILGLGTDLVFVPANSFCLCARRVLHYDPSH